MTTLILAGLLTFPVLSMGISSVESNHNFLILGDKGKSHGMFQVQPHWGKVKWNVRSQMEQHNRILLELMQASGHDVVQAVSRYNGGKRNMKYVGKVTQAMLEHELLGR